MERATILSAMRLLKQLLPEDYVEDLQMNHGMNRLCVYSPYMVVWMMTYQRLQKGATFEEAVQEMLEGESANELSDCKKVRSGNISRRTGAYSHARKRLPLELVEEASDHIFNTLCEAGGAEEGRRYFIVDGLTLKLETTKELREAFPPSGTDSMWPVLSVVVAHDAHTGVAARPVWGPMYGEKAINEVQLSRQLFERMPRGSIVIGDRAFGIFSVVNAVISNGHDVVVRLKDERAKRISGRLPRGSAEEEVEWRASDLELRRYSELTGEERIRGRIITRKLKGKKANGQAEYLRIFTTLVDVSADEIVDSYGLRWNVEIDIRDLKQTMKLNYLRSKTVDMVIKELHLAIIAYNIVNELRRQIARKSGDRPRDLSFTRVMREAYNDGQRIVLGHELTLRQIMFREAVASNTAHFRVQKSKKPRSYPRCVRRRAQKYPYKKAHSYA